MSAYIRALSRPPSMILSHLLLRFHSRRRLLIRNHPIRLQLILIDVSFCSIEISPPFKHPRKGEPIKESSNCVPLLRASYNTSDLARDSAQEGLEFESRVCLEHKMKMGSSICVLVDFDIEAPGLLIDQAAYAASVL